MYIFGMLSEVSPFEVAFGKWMQRSYASEHMKLISKPLPSPKLCHHQRLSLFLKILKYLQF
jgi:hypothetical protein